MRPYTPAGLAEHWGCSDEKIRQMCNAGTLRYFKIGKHYRIPVDAVEEYECNSSELAGSTGATPLPGTSRTVGGGDFVLKHAHERKLRRKH
ncbi:helix-turn-helix domain-containing protein [Paracoccus sulfuroxidans]|uniref:Excisionase family DNA binding protein n=1 Tax=Paracoccus sulfuroxidans TaxID=384678 RepID=A0A562NKQ0_9RHOB|nr:excisionase family DNA binding protein [Paracoccus sulfuroxidans]